MKGYGSIKWRLFLAAILTTGLALAIAGVGLGYLFERHIARRVDADMDILMRRTVAHIEVSANTGELSVLTPPGRGNRQRANMPYGGYYWQITENGKVLRTSRSLWDQTIAAPPREPSGSNEVQRYSAEGPRGTELRVMFRQLIIDRPNDAPAKIGVFVAVDNSAVTEPRQEFMKDIVPSLALLAVFLIAATGIYLVYGLRPLETVRREVNAIRSGEKSRFSENVPSEVQPLSEELNALLDAQQAALQRARNRAADLAHGLKTPLTALSGDARRLREKGEDEIAADVDQAVDIMNRHVAREMARARIRNAGTIRSARIPLAATLMPLIETLRRTPAGENIDWRMTIAADIGIAMDRDDLIECMGNLLENAMRYAKSVVLLEASAIPEGLRLTVEDDGPGLGEEQCRSIQERGHRLDESGGAGLGLAIVHDVLEAYDARLTLDRGSLGGLRVIVDLPTARRIRD